MTPNDFTLDGNPPPAPFTFDDETAKAAWPMPVARAQSEMLASRVREAVLRLVERVMA